MTLSVGFRAPTEREIVEGGFGYFMSNLPEGARYTDPDLRLQEPGEIPDAALKKVRDALSFMNHEKLLSDWFGKWTTGNDAEKKPARKKISVAGLGKFLSSAEFLQRNEGTRIAWRRVGDRVLLFVDGFSYELGLKDLPFVKMISAGITINSRLLQKVLTKVAKENLVTLINSGTFYIS